MSARFRARAILRIDVNKERSKGYFWNNTVQVINENAIPLQLKTTQYLGYTPEKQRYSNYELVVKSEHRKS